jgi:DNA (cytosine-5)-methyltransferase 1
VVRSSNPGAPIEVNASAEGRVMRLRGYGNAIVAPVAEAFIRSYCEAVTA